MESFENTFVPLVSSELLLTELFVSDDIFIIGLKQPLCIGKSYFSLLHMRDIHLSLIVSMIK